MSAILALFAAYFAQGSPAERADLLIRNARIHTGDPAAPVARDMAIRGETIAAVGQDLAAWAGPGTRTIDAGGRTVVPGFIDSHGHVRGLGESLASLDFKGSASAEAAAAMVAREAAGRKPGDWIVGRGWDQTRWPGSAFPAADALDRAAPRTPVYLTRVDGHAAWVNRRAVEASDINAATPDPAGGRIHRDGKGSATGVLVDRAMRLVSARIPAAGPEQIQAFLSRGARECVRLGLTSVHDAGVGAAEIAAYEKLIAVGAMPVRIYAMIGGDGELWRSHLKSGPRTGSRLTVRSIKLMADGALGSRGAAMKEPYSDDPGNRGLTVTAKQTIERVAKEAVDRGFQVNTHAIGDRANRDVLDAYAAALGGRNDRRFRVEHAQVVSLADIPLFARYSVIASMQATHATSDMRWAEARVGPDRIEGAYAWRRFLDAGVRIANGSDFPVENANPIEGFHAAVARGGWRLSQRMTREEALRSFTADAAYAAFEERVKGRLMPGMLADFAILSGDILSIPEPEIPRVKVLTTVVGGRVEYEARP